MKHTGGDYFVKLFYCHGNAMTCRFVSANKFIWIVVKFISLRRFIKKETKYIENRNRIKNIYFVCK